MLDFENLRDGLNLVLFKISDTSEFRRTSSPSFSPDAKCVQTKQNAVDRIVMLIDIDPCHIRSLFKKKIIYLFI